MKILSLNVGQPREALWNGRVITTGIFKTPVADRRRVSTLNIEGDQQADLRVHGGIDKAVYAYAAESYAFWQTQLDRSDWEPGLFGENLTTEGLDEYAVRIGDVFQVGTVHLQAVQPRFPCFKLNVRFDLPDMIDRFYQAGRPGIYFRVVQEGEVQAGDPILLMEQSPWEVTVGGVSEAFVNKGADQEMVRKIVDVPLIPEGLRKVFQGFLEK